MPKIEKAKRFLLAFNNLDHSLRMQYGLKRGLPFGDVIRRCSSLNSVVRKYEEDLIDYSRLRNAIVHSSGDIIAEPTENVVDKMEKISALVCTPPRALESICSRNVLCLTGREKLKDVITIMYESGYSNLPVFNGKKILGVANGQRIINNLGYAIYNGDDLDDFVGKNTISSMVSREENLVYYHIADENINLESVLDKFYKNRKLLCIIITKDGTAESKPLGIITTTDIMDINTVMENF